jgi:hypothetical protein
MKKKGASHLPAPPVGRSCLDDGPIPTAPPKTSMVTNQHRKWQSWSTSFIHNFRLEPLLRMRKNRSNKGRCDMNREEILIFKEDNISRNTKFATA